MKKRTEKISFDNFIAFIILANFFNNYVGSTELLKTNQNKKADTHEKQKVSR